MSDSKKIQNEDQLNEESLDQVVGGVIQGGTGPLTSGFSGEETDPGDVMPPGTPAPPKPGK